MCFFCPNRAERAARRLLCSHYHLLCQRAPAAGKKTSLVHQEEEDEEVAQSPEEPLLKSHSLQEAREPRLEERTRAQSKRLEWFEEVGWAEVGLWGCHGPRGGAGALLQEVLRLGRQWKDEIPQLEDCTTDSASGWLGHEGSPQLLPPPPHEVRTGRHRSRSRSTDPTPTSEQEPPRQTRSLFRGSGFPGGRPEWPAPSAAG